MSNYQLNIYLWKRIRLVFPWVFSFPFSDKDMKLHGGIRVGDKTIWVASNTYKTQTSEYASAIISGATSPRKHMEEYFHKHIFVLLSLLINLSSSHLEPFISFQYPN